MKDSAPRPQEDLSLVRVVFIDAQGQRQEVQAKIGMTLLQVARAYDIDLEGACEGSLACSTCHVIVDPQWNSKLEEPSEDENDMLDLAFGLTETSRLGCQIILTPELDGLTVTLPPQTRNLNLNLLPK